MNISKWKHIIDDNHCGYNDTPNYSEIIKQNPLETEDIDYFEKIVKSGINGGERGYAAFPDNGGIDVALILLTEVKRLRSIKN